MDLVSEQTLASRVIQFPKRKKRGRKRSRGPLAKLFTLPCSGEELSARWVRLLHHHTRWEQMDTADLSTQLVPLSLVEQGVALGYKERFGERVMRQEVLEFVARISKRRKIFDRLSALGARPDELASAEEALFYLFDKNLVLSGRAKS